MMETDISAQITSDFRRKSGPEVGHLTTEFSLDVGHLNGFLAPGWGMCKFRIYQYISIDCSSISNINWLITIDFHYLPLSLIGQARVEEYALFAMFVLSFLRVEKKEEAVNNPAGVHSSHNLISKGNHTVPQWDIVKPIGYFLSHVSSRIGIRNKWS